MNVFCKHLQHYLLKVFKVFNKAAVEVCVGQQLDIDFEKAAIVSTRGISTYD